MDFIEDDVITPPKIVQSYASEFRTHSFTLQKLRQKLIAATTKREVVKNENSRYSSDLQKTLMDFILAYMMEEPNDMIEYAVSHFTNLQRSRHRSNLREHLEKHHESGSSSTSSDLLDLKKSTNPSSRRSSVFSETFSPNYFTEDVDDVDDHLIIPKTDKQRKRLLDAIKKSIICNALQLEKMCQVVDAMYEKNVCAGDVVIHEGDEGDNFYIIEHGTFDIYRGAEHIDVLTKGSFGEMALLYNVVRTATVQAMTNGKLWVMNRQTFRKILHAHEMEKQDRYKMLIKDVPLLHNLDKYNKIQIIDAFETKYYPKGDLIIKQGDDPTGMYFIEKGCVSLYDNRNTNQCNIMVGKLIKSQYFGHLALLTKSQVHYSVYGDTDVKCVFINTTNFHLYMKKCFPDLIKSILYDFTVTLDDEMIYKLRTMQSRIEYDAYFS